MERTARERLAEAIELFGHDGMLLVFHDPDDPGGTTADGPDLPPRSGLGGDRADLRRKLAQVNARSRGELL
ncbi:hypothetical protein [Streptomyces sp. SID2888]|uniref:hypothetical protein n=1 Tax=Streptomyces sp. SID2888 TaxID=2690256 RepID=UPI00136B3546|nr:hypothetical protein [Streptomyces sp. SID2888]MYV48234.1 hypothetical protein [Streptomyces sp. SID2888]